MTVDIRHRRNKNQQWECVVCGATHIAHIDRTYAACPLCAIAAARDATQDGIVAKAGRMASAYKRWVMAGRPVRSPERIAEIFDTLCKPCEFFKPTRNPNDGSCEKCGCSLKRRGKLMNKIRLASESCPAGKWAAEVKTDAEGNRIDG